MFHLVGDMKEKILTVTIKDCRVDTFRSGGKGGQHQNVRDTGVRVVHVPSGAVGESREERSQLQNKRAAFVRMANSDKFKVWVKKETSQYLAEESKIETKVDRMMTPHNLKVEVVENGEWVESDE